MHIQRPLQNQTQFGNGYAVSGATKMAANTAEKLFSFPLNLAAKEGGNAVSARARRFLARLTGYDYNEVAKVGKFLLPDLPSGALIALLYPFTIGPRLKRAIQRDPSGTEKWDVIRRDGTAITIFVFLLKPLVTALTTIKQKMDGLKLSTPAAKHSILGKLFSYKELESAYKITDSSVLEAIMAHGNGEGLRKAGDKMVKNYRALLNSVTAEGGDKTLKLLEEVNAKVQELTQHSATLPSGHVLDDTSKVLAEEIYGLLSKAEDSLSVLRTKVSQQNSPKFFKTIKLLPPIKDFMAHFAKSKRMPMDMLGFAIVVAGLGWFPVWFNDLLSQKRRLEGAAQQRTEANASFDPKAAYQSLKQSSRLGQTFTQQNSPFKGF